MAATAIILDSREPENIKNLEFGGIPVSIAMLPSSDAMIACDDGTMILVERKTLGDLLGSIKDGRVFIQVAEMSTVTRWVYLVVTDPITYGPQSTVITSRGETGWNFNSVWGALITLQELGAFVVFCSGDQDYEACILRLANRSRSAEQVLEPAKMPHILTAQEQVLSALPGIGPDRARDLLTQFGTPALALMGLTDPNWEIPNIKGGIKNKVRSALKLAEGESLVVTTGPDGREWVDVNKSFIQEKVNE
jgi:ERCC4-type nuclease